tara:strand:- start:637 stop:906 length:270 start_codon:yes stop_codon:yes gene_type:complete
MNVSARRKRDVLEVKYFIMAVAIDSTTFLPSLTLPLSHSSLSLSLSLSYSFYLLLVLSLYTFSFGRYLEKICNIFGKDVVWYNDRNTGG